MDATRRRMWIDGLVAGLIGYLVVAAFFAIWNALQGLSPFYTAALLGEALFAGLRDPAAVSVDPGLVIAFNGVHLLAFLGFGYFGAWLVHETELHPEFWYLAFFLFLAATVLSYAAVLALTVLVGSILSPWLVVGSSLLAAVAVAAYFAGAHRGLLGTIRELDSQPMDGLEGDPPGR
jgi:hypothetical protein